MVWKKVAFAEVFARAFHTATPLVYDGTPAVLYIGGFSKFNDQLSRYSLSEMLILQVFSDVHFQMKKIVIPVILPKVSYHATVHITPYLFVFGGLQDNVKGGTSNLFVINILDLSVDILDIGQQFTSAGPSALKLSDDCIMVSGGVSKQFFTYSSKAMANTHRGNTPSISVSCVQLQPVKQEYSSSKASVLPKHLADHQQWIHGEPGSFGNV